MPREVTLLHDEIEDLTPDMGGCIATDLISVDGEPVRFMFRAPPQDPTDSGWRFLSGLEDDEYMANEDNHGVFDVNTIANHDRGIIPHLDAPVGSAFSLTEAGVFEPVTED